MRGKGRHHTLKKLGVAFEHVQFGGTLVEAALDDVGDELLLDVHELFEGAEGDLGLDHPEFLEVAAGLAFFGAEGGAEAVDFAEGEDVGLVVELTGLRQVGGLAVEVNLEEGGGTFGGGRRDDGGVDVEKAVAVEPVANAADDDGADAHGGPLAGGTQPEVAVLHEELDPMFLGGDGIGVGDAEGFEVADVELETAGDAGGAWFGAHEAPDDDAAFLGEGLGDLEVVGRDVVAEDDGLAHAGAVAHLEEVELAFAGFVVEPALEGDFCADVVFEFTDGYDGGGVRTRSLCLQSRRLSFLVFFVVAALTIAALIVSPKRFWASRFACFPGVFPTSPVVLGLGKHVGEDGGAVVGDVAGEEF